MDLWLVYLGIGAALAGAAVWAAAAGSTRQDAGGASLLSEASALRRLMWPPFAGALVLAFLTGWALREPDPADEWVALEVYVLAAVTGGVALRALVRAVVAALARLDARTPVVTVGLLRCRVIVSDAYRRAAGPAVLCAALAHETAHARGHDPLRIWLAQLAADLQWPVPGARRRLHDWLLALELRRDDEALASGVSPTALAESILLAARFRSGITTLPAAAITGTGTSGIALRIRRLLASDAGAPASGHDCARHVPLLCSVALVVAGLLGAWYGEQLLVVLPGVWR
jgi:hypothetical protein